MVKEGYAFGLPLVLVAGGLLGFGLFRPALFFELAGALFLILALFVLNFFRDPERKIPADSRCLVSPADGKVVLIQETTADGVACRQVSIFMSPFNVHVNRSPIAGTIKSVVYRQGSFRIASDPRASVENEQNAFTLEGEQGTVVVKQIAGVLARRIVFWKKIGDRLERGERVGLIKFGSRVDVLLGPNVQLQVKLGDRLHAGSSILGFTSEPTG